MFSNSLNFISKISNTCDYLKRIPVTHVRTREREAVAEEKQSTMEENASLREPHTENSRPQLSHDHKKSEGKHATLWVDIRLKK
jgi:hypothetical protein